MALPDQGAQLFKASFLEAFAFIALSLLLLFVSLSPASADPFYPSFHMGFDALTGVTYDPVGGPGPAGSSSLSATALSPYFSSQLTPYSDIYLSFDLTPFLAESGAQLFADTDWADALSLYAEADLGRTLAPLSQWRWLTRLDYNANGSLTTPVLTGWGYEDGARGTVTGPSSLAWINKASYDFGATGIFGFETGINIMSFFGAPSDAPTISYDSDTGSVTGVSGEGFYPQATVAFTYESSSTPLIPFIFMGGYMKVSLYYTSDASAGTSSFDQRRGIARYASAGAMEPMGIGGSGYFADSWVVGASNISESENSFLKVKATFYLEERAPYYSSYVSSSGSIPSQAWGLNEVTLGDALDVTVKSVMDGLTLSLSGRSLFENDNTLFSMLTITAASARLQMSPVFSVMAGIEFPFIYSKGDDRFTGSISNHDPEFDMSVDASVQVTIPFRYGLGGGITFQLGYYAPMIFQLMSDGQRQAYEQLIGYHTITAPKVLGSDEHGNPLNSGLYFNIGLHL